MYFNIGIIIFPLVIGFCADNDEYKRKVLVAFKKAGYIDDPTFVIIMVRFRGIMYGKVTIHA